MTKSTFGQLNVSEEVGFGPMAWLGASMSGVNHWSALACAIISRSFRPSERKSIIYCFIFNESATFAKLPPHAVGLGLRTCATCVERRK